MVRFKLTDACSQCSVMFLDVCDCSIKDVSSKQGSTLSWGTLGYNMTFDSKQEAMNLSSLTLCRSSSLHPFWIPTAKGFERRVLAPILL
ncbi:hypothetical protein HBH56_036420 [Parastagonospora nodorum]|uniref:Uncharacterized protein n=1 Tax=Phaeosphaeria nodorum (strain SN15 / ATCC MYA-4574 / FGSC 10173) TaxID=321614 RepID=A0A7U2F779_PHANO|nr:hypothetical protein HBH56_036420 [Parastagonospora nodorum]QRD00023.1 hypothetical protein JI435_304900 [Parastagonospora nodorum SN15]KAH3980324.1 hypothetical protein HBH52_094220 [Parastagonospora nodorum]KAH4098013.1 hypothetical protein HBH48_027270 [Parastagonospora nodorum]KAH4175017.1 hypothetical protein HBH44_004660 [Parastagonospora nodorum]